MLYMAFLSCGSYSEWLIVDFDESLGRGHAPYKSMIANTADEKRYQLLKKIWKERALVDRSAVDPAIPTIIHQIWLGPKPLPPFFEKYQKEIKRLHPDWQYKLWRDADVEAEGLDIWPLVQQCSNYGQKSDLVRLELLRRYGGVYLDVDIFAVRSFDPLVQRYDFFAGLEAPHGIGKRSPHMLFISNAVIASAPHHPILSLWHEKIKEAFNTAKGQRLDIVQHVLMTTFFTFGEAVEEGIQSSKNSIIFPPTYFFPLMPPNKSRPKKEVSRKRRFFEFLGLKKKRIFTTIRPETIVVHDFANTWEEK